MKWFLGFFLAIGILVTVCDAYCYFQQNNLKESTEGCIQNGELYEFGTAWRSEDCHSCNCSHRGIRCCSTVHSPVNYDRNMCRMVFNKDTCSVKVVEKTDPSKECEVHGWVG
ncbi:PREDICTED: beta-microseminoprotein-like [Crocodylus porosus]|uniref:Beta-microseminoprotein-like n=1 Tax=Crocodylus porosus TaxID=8502 RepID=A0A7M4FPF5_CROPO|nr:PREDICTED: beta-microseminoprotein-like [Crocodylus porosus]